MPCSKNSQEGTNANAKGCCSSTGNQTETPPGTRTVVHHNHNHNDNDNDKNYSNDAINSKSGSSCCINTTTTTNGNGNGKDGSKSSSSSCSSNIKDNDKDNGNSNGKSNGNHTDDHTSNHHNHGHNHNHGHDHNHGHGHGHNHCSGNKNNSNQTQTHATKQVNEPSDNGNVVPCCSNNNGNDNANDNANAKESTSTRTRNHDKPDCIAILRENGHVDVYDVNGQVKSFSSDKNANTTTATATVPTATPSATATKSAVDPNNICFSSHGHDVDEFLTPCFDELGQHGDPEEGCFCGIDTPHLHAHVHNDKTCIDHDDHDHDKNDVSRLSQLTFHPVEYDSNSNSKQDQHQHQYQYQPLIESESMPNACNAQELKSKLNRTDGNRNRKDYRNANNNVFQIRHDQHVDTLVHNSNNGNLMLEHDCGDCGDHDVHGTLELVSKREWNRNHPSNPNSSSSSNPSSVARTRTRMHFYTIPKTPLRLLDLLADFFAMDEDKASILRNAFPPCPKRVSRRPCCPPPPCCTEGTCSTGTGESDVDVEQLEAGVEQAVAGSGAGTGTVRTSGKSSFFVSGICCASEIPAINSILDPLNGVDKVTINVTNKTVYVYHQFELMSAHGIKAVLDAEKFDARITKDAGAEAAAKQSRNVTLALTTSGKSSFFVSGICCASEIPAINSILEPLNGVDKVTINVTNKTVYVYHQFELMSAHGIKAVLDAEKFDARITKDAGAEAAAKQSRNVTLALTTSGKSSFFVSGICCASEIPAINSILEPLNGVDKVTINVTNKTVYVYHQFELMSAQGIKAVLDAEKFDARITKDAGAEAAAKLSQTRSTVMSKYVESTFMVPSLLESADATRLKQVLRHHYSKDQMSHSETHVPSKTIKIDHNPQLLSTETLTEFLKKEGFGDGVTLVVDGFKEGIWSEGEEDEIEEHSTKLELNVALSGMFWIVSMLHLVDTESGWDYLKYAAFVSVALGIPKIATKAFTTMRRRQFDTNCMMLFATIGALALQEYAEAAAVTFLFSISDWLETISTSRARIALSAIVRLRPERAKVQDPISSKFVYVPASDVAVGSIVSVRTGEYTCTYRYTYCTIHFFHLILTFAAFLHLLIIFSPSCELYR
jgi:cation transport ATPase